MSYIEDGKGRGYKASVSSSNRINVSSKSNPRAYYVCRDNEDAYSLGTGYAASDGDYVLYIQNTDSSKEMVLTDITLSSSASAKFNIDVVSGTAAGTDAVPLNLKLGAANTVSAVCKANAAVTGLTKTGSLHITNVGAEDHVELHFMESLIIPKGQALAIKYNGIGAEVDVSIMLFMETHSGQVN